MCSVQWTSLKLNSNKCQSIIMFCLYMCYIINYMYVYILIVVVGTFVKSYCIHIFSAPVWVFVNVIGARHKTSVFIIQSVVIPTMVNRAAQHHHRLRDLIC